MEIILTQGFVTEIDDCDEDLDRNYNWFYAHGYAARHLQVGELDYPNSIALHTIILERKLKRNLQKGYMTDHKDRDGLNNKRDNLREATRSINALNSKITRSNISGFRGVRKEGNRWRADIKIKGVQVYLGTYDLPEEASEAYLSKYYEIYNEYPPEIEKEKM